MSSGGQRIWWYDCVAQDYCWLHILAQLSRYRGWGEFELWRVQRRTRIWQVLFLSDILAFILFWSISIFLFHRTVDSWYCCKDYISWNQSLHRINNKRREQMVQSGPGGSLLIPLVCFWLGGRIGVHHFWDRCQRRSPLWTDCWKGPAVCFCSRFYGCNPRENIGTRLRQSNLVPYFCSCGVVHCPFSRRICM